MRVFNSTMYLIKRFLEGALKRLRIHNYSSIRQTMKEGWNIISTMCFWCLLSLIVGCGSKRDQKLSSPDIFVKLASLDQVLETPRYGEWLFSHPEKGQSFQQYTSLPPVSVTSTRRIIELKLN